MKLTPCFVTRKGQVLSVIVSAIVTKPKSAAKAAAQQRTKYRSSGSLSNTLSLTPSTPFLCPAAVKANTRQASAPAAPTSTMGSHQ